jgi:glycosyltransferase involved in cell wall biosynthesis
MRQTATGSRGQPGAAPTVSAILLSYNCAEFIAEAVRSVLDQQCVPMDVHLSDDASCDGTFEILQAEVARYSGPHRVFLRRRVANAGSKSAHLNDVFSGTMGEILVSFDGDDVSEPFRVRRIVEAFAASSEVQAVYSGYSLIEAGGRRVGRGRVPHPPQHVDTRRWFARVDAYAAGTTLAVRREVVEKFGLLDPAINEDIVLPFRASLLGEVKYLDEDLVRVRRWDGSLTAAPKRFEDIDAYRSRMLQGIESAERQLAGRLSDLDKAERLMPSRADEFDELRRVARSTLADAKATADLLSPSLERRTRCFLRLMRSGAYRDEFVRHACLAFAPNAYLWYKRRARGGVGPRVATEPPQEAHWSAGSIAREVSFRSLLVGSWRMAHRVCGRGSRDG